MDTIVLVILTIYLISFLSEWKYPFNGLFFGTLLNLLVAFLVLIILGISAIIRHFF